MLTDVSEELTASIIQLAALLYGGLNLLFQYDNG
jgi:hypothetical protein